MNFRPNQWLWCAPRYSNWLARPGPAQPSVDSFGWSQCRTLGRMATGPRPSGSPSPTSSSTSLQLDLTTAPQSLVRSRALQPARVVLGLTKPLDGAEGLKAFRQPDGHVRVFRPKDNAVRFNHSAAIVSMPDVPEELFLEAIEIAVGRNLEFVPPHAPNGLSGSLYVRPLLVSKITSQFCFDPPPDQGVFPRGRCRRCHLAAPPS